MNKTNTDILYFIQDEMAKIPDTKDCNDVQLSRLNTLMDVGEYIMKQLEESKHDTNTV